jgi:predicted phage terminase large subunit-like protein
MTAIEEAKILKVATQKCKHSLLFHTRYFFMKRYQRKYKVLYHHIRIADALERVLKGEITKLAISVGPRLGKTEISVKGFISHGLALNPASKYIHLTATDALALDNSEGTKDIVQSPEYKAMFPGVKIKQSTDSKKKWYTTAGGGVYATSASGTVTGFGAGTSDYEDEDQELNEFITAIEEKEGFGGAIIYDDSLKPDDAESDVVRERVNRKYISTVQNRRNSRKTPIIVIMQRLHPKDLIGYLEEIEPGEWEIINLPALYIDEHGAMQSLDPSIYSVEDLLKMEKNDDEEVRLFFQRQLQQNPRSREGLMFSEEELHFYNPANTNPEKQSEYSFVYIDPADEGGDDLSAPAVKLVGNKLYIDDVIYNNHGTDVNEPACVEFLKKHRCAAAEIESNSAWILFGKAVRTAIQEDGSDCQIRIIKPYTNKHVRINAQSAFIKMHFVFRSDWHTCSPQYRKFMECILSYRRIQEGLSKNKHDDAPDSMAGVAQYFRRMFPELWKVISRSE